MATLPMLLHPIPVSTQEPIGLLPDGFKFTPDDKQLVGYYLYNYILGKHPLSRFHPLQKLDLYGEDEPWELWAKLQITGGNIPNSDVYLFTELKTKSKNPNAAGGKQNVSRKVGKSQGSWHGEDKKDGTKKYILKIGDGQPDWVAIRKRYSYQNRKLGSENAKWILHEFTISNDGENTFFPKVVCVLKNNNSPAAAKKFTTAKKELAGGGKKKRKLDEMLESICPGEEINGSAPERFQCHSPQSVLGEQSCNFGQEISVPVTPAAESSSIVPSSIFPSQETAAFEENEGWLGFTVSLEELLGDEEIAPLEFSDSGLVESAAIVPAETSQETAAFEENDDWMGHYCFSLEEQLDVEEVAEQVSEINDVVVNEERQEEQNYDSFFSTFDYSEQVGEEEARELPPNCSASTSYSDLEGILNDDDQFMMPTPGISNHDHQPAADVANQESQGDDRNDAAFDVQQQEEDCGFDGFAAALASEFELPPTWSPPSLMLNETGNYSFEGCTDVWDWDVSLADFPCF